MYSSISYSKVSHPQETIDSFFKIKLVCFQKGSKRFVTNILIRKNGMEEKQINFRGFNFYEKFSYASF